MTVVTVVTKPNSPNKNSSQTVFPNKMIWKNKNIMRIRIGRTNSCGDKMTVKNKKY